MNHGRSFRAHSGEPGFRELAEILTDHRTAALLDDADKAMLSFAEKLTLRHQEMGEADIEGLRAAGFREEHIVDIIAAVAYRNFANRINFATGDFDRDPEGPPEMLEVFRRVKEAPS